MAFSIKAISPGTSVDPKDTTRESGVDSDATRLRQGLGTKPRTHAPFRLVVSCNAGVVCPIGQAYIMAVIVPSRRDQDVKNEPSLTIGRSFARVRRTMPAVIHSAGKIPAVPRSMTEQLNMTPDCNLRRHELGMEFICKTQFDS